MILTVLIVFKLDTFWTLDLQTEFLNNIGWFNEFSNSLRIAMCYTQGYIYARTETHFCTNYKIITSRLE